MPIPRTVREAFPLSHTAVIVVDVQNDFCAEGGHFHRFGRDLTAIASALPRLQRFLEGARSSGVPLVHLQQATLPGGLSDSPAWRYFKARDGKDPEYTLPGSWGHEFVGGFEPQPDEAVIRKFRSSGFHNTALDTVLRARGIRSLVVCGVETDGCVETTLRDAAFHDYFVCLVEDCCASAKPEMHDHALAVIRAHHPVVPSGDILSWWKG